MKRIVQRLAIGSSIAFLALVSFGPAFASAANAPTIATSQTVANVSVGVNDQSNITSTPTANTPETKANLVLSVATAPVDANTITIGSCVVTFATTTAGSPAQDLNCNDNVAKVTVSTTTSDIAKTPAQIATGLAQLTNVSDTVNGHGVLAVAAGTSSALVSFTTSATEASSTVIKFTDGTSGKVVSSISTAGVVPVAQVNRATLGGTVETGDVFTLTIPAGIVSYTVASGDTTLTNIATGLNAALQATSTYSSQAFTSSASTNTVVLTAKTAGTGFTQTSGAVNFPGVAQKVSFTPTDFDSGYVYQIVINSSTYSSSADTLAGVLTELTSALAADSSVSCTQDGTAITCTALTPGTAFTYSATDFTVRASGGSSHGGGGGGGGGSSSSASNSSSVTTSTSSLNDMISALKAQLATLMARAGMTTGSVSVLPTGSFSRDLTAGSVGADVRALQAYLNAHGFMVSSTGAGAPGGETTTFGGATKAALIKFQAAKGITPAAGYFGAKTRAYIAANP